MGPPPAQPQRRFANHPGAKETPAEAMAYQHVMGNIPTLRGLPLVALSTLVTNLTYFQKYFFVNANLGKPKEIPGLDKEVAILNPTVIPLLSDDASSRQAAPGVEPALFPPQPAELAGRYYSAADYHALYSSGAATPLQVAEALLTLILPPSKYADAWRWVNRHLVLASAKASTERWASGAPLGILDGVPFGVKEDVDTAGYITTTGMRVDPAVPWFTRTATESEHCVRRLEEAGAVLMGKMYMHEIGLDTMGCNPRNGTPTNWFNKSYYPGGSSSGPASSLGAGLVPITVGTDAGGSVRIPPAFNGVYGLKPSHGRLGTAPVSTVCVWAPMGATVTDLTIAYRTMASNPDPRNATTSLFAPSIPPSKSQKRYLGIFSPWMTAATKPMLDTINPVIDHLVTACGYERVEISLPYIEVGQAAHSGLCLSEAYVEAAARVQGTDRHPFSIVNHVNAMMLAVGSVVPAADYLSYSRVRGIHMRHLAHLFEKYPGLIILSPTTPMPGWKKTPGDETYGLLEPNISVWNMVYSYLANTTGCPAVSCPAGYVDPEVGEGKLPVGVMGMAEWGGEETCLEFARQVEKYLNDVYPGGRRRPVEWADVIGEVKRTTSTGGAKVDGADGANVPYRRTGRTGHTE